MTHEVPENVVNYFCLPTTLLESLTQLIAKVDKVIRMMANMEPTLSRFNVWHSHGSQARKLVLLCALMSFVWYEMKNCSYTATTIYHVAGIHRRSTIVTNTTLISNVETIAVHAESFDEGPAMLCSELMNRANGTEEGWEPWRSSGGLLWTHSHCGGAAVGSLGNHLSRWYLARALASAAGVTIHLDCRSPVTDLIPQHWEPSQTILDNPSSFSWKETCQNKDIDLLYPHGSKPKGSALDHAVGLIRSDLRQMTQTVLSNSPPLAEDLDEAVIHLRLGDIGRTPYTLYGLVPFYVYTNLIPRAAKTIGIITAPFNKKRGRIDEDLNEAVTVAARNYIQREFPDARVSIRNGDESMAVVYARLVAADWSFCGSSSFCLYPALASAGESFILQSPLFGGSPGWLDNVADSFENVHYIEGEIIFSDEYWTWGVSEIVKRLQCKIDHSEASQ